jgi:hypothetical protein
MQHLITLYTPELLQAFSVLTALLFGANILQAIAAINKRNALTEAEDGKQAAMDMLKQATDKAAKIQSERDTWKKTAKEVEADRDRILADMKEVQKTAAYWIDTAEKLKAERATLYFRNALGQIEPITPKERKPHTLKHGMTVKDPSAYQAKRIFAAAKRAGMDWDNVPPVEDDKMSLDIIFWEYEWNGEKESVVAPRPNSYEVTTYISAREFLRRIKGEIE